MFYPILVVSGLSRREPIASLPDQFRLSPDQAAQLAVRLRDFDRRDLMCYGLPDRKDETSSNGVDPEGPVPSAILLKEATAPDVAAITEVRLREYASHGRRGLVASQRILNDPTLPHLAAQALAHVQAEADMVAHSDMVGGRAGTLRAELDQTDFKHDPIMNYSAKYANVFNGPLR